MKTELHKSVQEFLSQPLPHFVGGRARMSATGKVVNPSDGSVPAEVAMGGAAEIELGVTAAEKAFPA